MVDRPTEAVTRRERLVVAAVVIATIAALPLFGGSVLWTRPLWLDEICCTLYPVAGAATPADVIRAVASGSDFAPPLLHLIVWSVGRVFGDLTPVLLRSTSLACVSLALALLYFTLRRRFDRAPSAAGVLAVASHALVLTHAFEARFYGPWLLFTIGVAFVILSEAKDPQARTRSFPFASLRAGAALRMTTVAIASVLLVTIHWFGVITLAFIVAAAVASHGRNWRGGLRLVAPTAAGFVAFLACLPMLLAHRAGAVRVGALWVPPLSLAQVEVMVRLFFASAVPVLAALILAAGALLAFRAKQPVAANLRDALREPGIAALAAMALFPGFLIVLSATVQPSMLDRYAITTVLAWAPLVALAVAWLGRYARLAAVAFLAVFVTRGMQRSIAERRALAEQVAVTAAAFAEARTRQLPIVFPSLLALYPVAGPTRDQSALFLDLPDSTINALVPQPRLDWLRRNLAVERNIARGHHQHYGFPDLATLPWLDTTTRFLLVASDDELPRLYQRVDLFSAAVFPRHRLTRLTPNLALLER